MSIVIYNDVTGEESLGVHIEKRADLIEAMRFKAKHIKCRMNPEVFEAVAAALENSVEVVRFEDEERGGAS